MGYRLSKQDNGIGLCERTGPWQHYVVMTNAPGVTRKVPKSRSARG